MDASDGEASMVLSSSPIAEQEHAYACVDPSLVFGFIAQNVEIGCDDDDDDDLPSHAGDDDDSLSYNTENNTPSDYASCKTFPQTNDLNTGSDASFFAAASASTPQSQMQKTKKTIKNHHKGPVSQSYIVDKRQHQKTASKRSKTLVNVATRLQNMCGGELHLKYTRETGMETTLDLPQPITKRHVKVQAGESQLVKKTKPTPEEGTPKKRPLPQAKPETAPKKISNLPGKKKELNLSPNYINRIKNKCYFCKIIFDSAADKSFREKNGRKKAIWLGCDTDECGSWAHAMCAQVEAPCLKRAKSIPYYCPAHIS